MLTVRMLYRPFHLKKSYKDINEDEILCGLYDYRTGTVEMAVSRLINEAVLSHMHLYIDSTIMQVLALNEYLSALFMTNLESLIFNYLIHKLEYKQIEEVDEKIVSHIEALAQSVDMKTDLETLLVKLEKICKDIE